MQLFNIPVLIAIAALLLALCLAVLVARRVTRERRHDAARKQCCARLSSLAGQILEAEGSASAPASQPWCASELDACKGELRELNEKRDLYDEQGATIPEWRKLGAVADKLSARVNRVWTQAVADCQSSTLATNAIARASQALEQTDDPAAAAAGGELLAAARQLFEDRAYEDALKQERATLAAVGKTPVEPPPSCCPPRRSGS